MIYKSNSLSLSHSLSDTLCEKCTNTEFFLVRIEENTDQKKLHI